jgi:hypothetical protein
LSRKSRIFFTEINIRLYDKNSEQIILFPPPKSEYFFQQHWESEKNHTPPLQVKWSFPNNILLGSYFKWPTTDERTFLNGIHTKSCFPIGLIGQYI